MRLAHSKSVGSYKVVDEAREALLVILKEVAAASTEDLLTPFEKGWNANTYFRSSTWFEYRAGKGTSALVFVMKAKHSFMRKNATMCDNLCLQMIKAHPELVTGEGATKLVYQTKQPYLGVTPLMMAVVNGDLKQLELMLDVLARTPDKGKQMINFGSTGEFFHGLFHCDDPPVQVTRSKVTALMLAFVAPCTDDESISMAKQLLDHGASTYKVNESDNSDAHGTILHFIAKTRWNKRLRGEADGKVDGQPFDMGEERLVMAIDFLLDGDDNVDPVDVYLLDIDGYSAMHLAALFGNETCVQHLLKKTAETSWAWGRKCEIRVPLKGIDSGSREHETMSALELAAFYEHRQLLTLVLFTELVHAKWEKFGKFFVSVELVWMIVIVIACTVASLGDDSFPSGVRVKSRVLTIAMCCVYVCYVCVMIWLARDTQWFKRMRFMPAPNEIDVCQLGPVRNIVMMCLISTVMGLQLTEENVAISQSHIYYLDSLTAVLVLILWAALLRFLQLFESTGLLLTALPTIIFRDMWPWIIVFVVLLFGSAASIRVSLKHTSHDAHAAEDKEMGSFFKTVVTLFETTFGPDAHLRATIIQRPFLSMSLYMFFLWLVAIVLLNLLIAMFSDTFEKVRERAYRVMLHHRAVEVITQEKLMPVWLHRKIGAAIGDEMPLGLRDPFDAARRCSHAGEAPTENTALVSKSERWLRIRHSLHEPTWVDFADHEV